jgi:flagellar biogenesis protein FliO
MAERDTTDRRMLARMAARRRAARARVAAVGAALAVAWCAHAAHAMAAVQSAEHQPLGSAQSVAGGTAGGALGEVLRMAGALAVVVALAFAARWWLRRTGLAQRMQGGAFEVIGRHPVGRGQSVLVARFGPRLLCVQQGRDGLRTLCELSDPSEIASALAQARGAAAAPASESRTVDLRRGKESGA